MSFSNENFMKFVTSEFFEIKVTLSRRNFVCENDDEHKTLLKRELKRKKHEHTYKTQRLSYN